MNTKLTKELAMDGITRKINISEGLIKKGGVMTTQQLSPIKRPPPPPPQKPKQ